MGTRNARSLPCYFAIGPGKARRCSGPSVFPGENVPRGGNIMSKLHLSLAVGDYDRTRPLADGRVQIDGADPVVMLLPPEEIFFRAFRHQAFDACELSLSSFTIKIAQNDCPYIGVPVFPS